MQGFEDPRPRPDSHVELKASQLVANFFDGKGNTKPNITPESVPGPTCSALRRIRLRPRDQPSNMGMNILIAMSDLKSLAKKNMEAQSN